MRIIRFADLVETPWKNGECVGIDYFLKETRNSLAYSRGTVTHVS